MSFSEDDDDDYPPSQHYRPPSPVDDDIETLSPEQVVQLMENELIKIRDITELNFAECRAILNAFQWQLQNVLEQYYEDSERVLRRSKITRPSTSLTGLRPASGDSAGRWRTDDRIECSICLLEVPSSWMCVLSCGHSFCRNCCYQYLTTKIMSYGQGDSIACPATNCDSLIDDGIVLQYVNKDAKTAATYHHLIADSFVQHNRELQWCPSRDCGHAVRSPMAGARAVNCENCKNCFCFKCLKPWHEPVDCARLQCWERKCSDESETANYINANTKSCPQCHAIIEKEGGCNHMTCKKCKKEFCWICMGPWEPHGSAWYNCNRFDDSEGQRARDEQERCRAALKRYLHYFERYNVHKQSLKEEEKLRTLVGNRMDQMQRQNNCTWIDVQYMNQACDTLCRCRKILMYSYVFAFYLARNNQVEIFEENQTLFNNAVEELSRLLEGGNNKEHDVVDGPAENVHELKRRITDQFRLCETRCSQLKSHIFEGDENGYWEFTN